MPSTMIRRAAYLALVALPCAGGFVAPASRVCFPSRSGARGRTAVDLLPGVSEQAIADNLDVGAAVPEALSLLSADVDAAHHPIGGIFSGWLLASTAPGNTYFATGLFGIAAAAIAVGAGYLVFSAVQGKNGLGAFLGQEKGSNPFYQDTMTKIMPKTPEILNKIRLPELDFVEIYNQPPADEFADDDDSGFNNPEIENGAQDATVVATAESLRQKLLEAVQAKDYDLASSLERELGSFLRKNGMNFEDDGK